MPSSSEVMVIVRGESSQSVGRILRNYLTQMDAEAEVFQSWFFVVRHIVALLD